MYTLIVYVRFCFYNVFVIPRYEWDDRSTLVCLRFWYYWAVVATRSIRPAKTCLRTYAKSKVPNLVLSSCTSILPAESPECSAAIYHMRVVNSQDIVDFHRHLPVCCGKLYQNIVIQFRPSPQTMIWYICSKVQFLCDENTQDFVPIP